MIVRPNQTIVEGSVRSSRPAPDGRGTELILDVQKNLSPNESEDFIRPKEGESLALYCNETPPVKEGMNVRVEATYLAGPRGGRNIAKSIKPKATLPE